MVEHIYKSKDEFAAAVRSADDVRLLGLYRWAVAKERSSDAPGTGRAVKGRRLFNAMTSIAAAELERRGLSY